MPRDPTPTNRGTPSGTLTRTKRRSPVAASITIAAMFSASDETYGNGAAEPTAIGVSSGAISRSNRFVRARRSRGVHSSNDTMRMPSAASAGRRTSSHSASWSAFKASTRSRASSSVCLAVRPSGDRRSTFDSTCSRVPAMRTAKNSSRFDETIPQSFTRSSSGTPGSAASSSTRRSKSSHDSSRLRNRSAGGAAGAASRGARSGKSRAGETAIRPPPP